MAGEGEQQLWPWLDELNPNKPPGKERAGGGTAPGYLVGEV